MRRLALLLALSFLFAPPLWAACTSPNGSAGEMTWDTAMTAFKYCDGTTWKGFGGVSGGSAGYGAVWSSAGALTYDSALYIDTTTHRVGIGTTPNEPLEVASASARMIVSDGAGASRRVLLLVGPTTGTDYARLESYAYPSTGKPLVINNVGGGYVGIGTASPGAALEVSGNILLSANSGSYRTFGQAASSNTTLVLQGGAASGTGGNIELTSAGSNVYDASTHIFRSLDGASEKMRIDSSTGNVGIGTASPAATALLEVSGTAKGFLPPRMTTTQRDAISSPATGLTVYNTTTAALNVYNGTAWGAVGAGVPAGTIAAFASTSCPTDWTEYVAARGRFLRGIDNGAGNDPDGTRSPSGTQGDLVGSHTHSVTTGALYQAAASLGGFANNVGMNFNQGTGTWYGGSYDLTGYFTIGGPSNPETRPKNVAVIFCTYNGGGNVPATATVSGTTNYVPKFTAAAAIGNSQIYDNGTNIGIGTTSPGTKLDVNGTARATVFDIGYEPHGCCTEVSTSAANNAWTGYVTLCSGTKKLLHYQCYSSGGGSVPNGTMIIGDMDSTGRQVRCYNGSGGPGIYIGAYLCANVQ